MIKASLGVRCVSVAALLIFAGPSSAQQPASCGSSSAEMRACVSDALRFAEKDMRDAYAALQSVMFKAKSTLPEDQDEWAKFREKHCALDAALYDGGSGYGVAVSSCMVSMTKDRAADLLARVEYWKKL